MTAQPTDHLTGGLRCIYFVNPATQTVIPAMYLTSTSCPTAVLSARVNLAVRMVVIFLTIWPPTEPASREVR